MNEVRGTPPEAQEIRALTERYELPKRAGDQLLALLERLLDDPFAPTAVRDSSKAVDDHLADSLVALELEEVRAAKHVADLGAGAGFPGLPLAVALPHATFALVESSRRKCEFITRAAAACEMRNVRAVHARAEAWPEGLESHDLVTVRALAPLTVVLEYGAPLLRIGGVVVAWRGRRDLQAEAAAGRAAGELGLEIGAVTRVLPYDGAEHRHLHLISKVRNTPRGFPRRPGMAVKRPLGGV